MSDAGRLFDRYGPSLYRYALMLLADRAAAEDVVQQVFASLLGQERPTHLDNEGHYLRRAVRNECHSARRRRPAMPIEDDAGQLLEARAAEVSIEERLTLERAIRALPVDQREVLHLHVFEGMTFQEIAHMAGESANTIASRYRYALRKIREEFRA